MDHNKIFGAKLFQGIIIGIVILIVILLVFKAGTMVGIRKADFSCRWSDNYHRNFGGPKSGFWSGFDDRNFMEANGTFGQIIKIEGNLLTIKDNKNTEKAILLDENTAIRSMRNILKITDLKIDDNIIVIGEPNESGQILAKLIRVMPTFPVSPPPLRKPF